MKTSVLNIVLFVVLGSFGMGLKAISSDKDYVKYSYHQGFEDKDVLNKIKKWTGTAEVETSIKKISNEQKVEGRSSLKLSVTFKTGGYYYLLLPLDHIPLEGSCWIDFKYYVKSSSTLRFMSGVSMGFPSIKITGGIEAANTGEKDKWVSFRWDLVERGLIKATSYLNSRKIPGVTPASCGKTLDGFVFMFIGKAGQSATVYIDDINIAGNVPSPQSYKDILVERDQRIYDATCLKIDAWRKELGSLSNKISKIPIISPSAVSFRETVEQYLSECLRRLDTMRESKTITIEDRLLIERPLFYREAILKNLRFFNQMQSVGDFNVYVVDPINPFGTKLNDQIVGGLLNGFIELDISRDEYEPTSIVVQANRQLKGVTLELGTFRNAAGKVLDNENIDIRVVKSWYKREMGIGRPLASRAQTGVLVPELLLYNDALIKVDMAEKNNYILLNDKYKLISKRKIHDSKIQELTLAEFPVRDSKTLLPVNIAPGTNKQFWITVFAPAGIAPGIYTGSIELKEDGLLLKNINCSINVNKFQLSKPKFVSSIYYRGVLADDLKGTISSEHKSVEQYAREMTNMLKHGVDSPTLYQKSNSLRLGNALKIRERAGINNKRIFYVGLSTGTNYIQHPSKILELIDKYKKVEELFATYGCESLFIMGQDEAKGEAITNQIPAWNALHEIGGKVFVAGDLDEYIGKHRMSLDCLNMNMSSAVVNEQLMKKIAGFKEKGELLGYSFPQVGAEDPYIYRRNFGLVLRAYGIQGAMNYAYQHSFNHPYNDFDHPVYKLHCFTYPTIDGVIDTVQWEGYREAIDDLRYFKTLEDAISKAEDSVSKAVQVKQAKLFTDSLLEKMKKFTAQNSVLEEIVDLRQNRKEMIRHINNLLQE